MKNVTKNASIVFALVSSLPLVGCTYETVEEIKQPPITIIVTLPETGAPTDDAAPTTDSGTPDTAPPVDADAGSDAPADGSTDSATDVATETSVDAADAATDAAETSVDAAPETLPVTAMLTNSFDGPAPGKVAAGQTGVSLYQFALTGTGAPLQDSNLAFALEAVPGSASTCTIVGSAGTHYFKKLRVINTDTGATITGPQEFPNMSGISSISFGYGPAESFDLTPDKTYRLALVADLASSEDAGDTFLDGKCAYRVTFFHFGSTDIKNLSTGTYLPTSQIIPNSDVIGNALTVTSSSLSVSLAATPSSSTVVKKQLGVPMVGNILTAGSSSDITATNVTVTCQASINGGAPLTSDCSKRITSLSMFRADTGAMIGLAAAVDPVTGKVTIKNTNLLIPKGTSLRVVFQATLSSSASPAAPFDWVSVGIANASDIQAQDQDSNTVIPKLDAAVVAQVTSPKPAVFQTIRNSGILTIAADSHPVSSIVIGGRDQWVPMAQYKASAQYEALNIDRLVALGGAVVPGYQADCANFTEVAVAMNGAVHGATVLPAGTTCWQDVDLSSDPIVVPKDGSIDFQLWAKIAAVQSSSSVGGAFSGVTRSGHAPSMGLIGNIQVGEWDVNYTDKLNVRTTGAASGERIYTANTGTYGNPMTIRKSMPIVTKQSLSSTTLTNVDQDLFKEQIAADSAGSIGFKQQIFAFSKTAGVELYNFRMRRGATEMDTSTYAITNGATGADLQVGSISPGTNFGYIVFAMRAGQEESISGSGNVYTLHATVAGATSGQNVTIALKRDSETPFPFIVTGWLTNAFAFDGYASSANIFHLKQPSGAGDHEYDGSFIWSDESEVPHSPGVYTFPLTGSADWTNDYLVQDLSQSQTLSL